MENKKEKVNITWLCLTRRAKRRGEARASAYNIDIIGKGGFSKKIGEIEAPIFLR